ncbi:MAG TPA: NAD(P)/FAD-dependent oxidoreductase [Vicinamibacteria bacterium]
MRIGIVGAGPAGALAGYRLARDGHEVVVFDASHPREKPCGGGLTARALDLLPPAPASDPLPARFTDRCQFESASGRAVELRLPRPVAIAPRRELDAWLLRRAVEAGAQHRPQHVAAVEPGARRLRTREGQEETFDLLVGADGADSVVRRAALGPLPTARRAMAVGWYARGTAEMTVRFLPGVAGYLWLFPRPDHVGVGACAPLGVPPTRDLVEQLRTEVARRYPALADEEAGLYAHTIPSPSADEASILEIAGEGWALVGDAAALADPITGEGISYALESAAILADRVRGEGGVAAYPAALLAAFGRSLVKAAAIHDRFFAPGFTARMVSFGARSAAVREVLADLVLGRQDYLGLKRRLLRRGPRVLLDLALAPLRG